MDLEQPKTWLETNEHWLGALAALVIIGTPLAAFFRRNIVDDVARLWRRRPRITFGDPTIPATRLTFVLHERRSFWHIGGTVDGPVMQIATDWFVTSVGRASVRILSARFIRPTAGGESQLIVSVDHPDEPEATAPHDVLIGRHSTVSLLIHGMIKPPPRHRPGKPLKVRIAVVDQYQEEHRSPVVLVPSR
jgi:hypothetical protein